MTFVTVHNITVVHVINQLDSQMLHVTHSHVLSPRLVTIKFYCFCKSLISCSQEDSLNCIFQMFIWGGSAPRSNPTHLYTIFHEKGTPFVYLLLTNGTPFTHLVQNFAPLLTAVNALSFKQESITKIEHFLDLKSHKIHLLALLGPFTDSNDRFPYTSLLCTSTGEIPTLSYT